MICKTKFFVVESVEDEVVIVDVLEDVWVNDFIFEKFFVTAVLACAHHSQLEMWIFILFIGQLLVCVQGSVCFPKRKRSKSLMIAPQKGI